jgi:hypothetical protein
MAQDVITISDARPDGARFFTNAINTRTDGVDVTAPYGAKVAASDLHLREQVWQ